MLAVATELEGFPRHLGIHPGGMVICDRPVSEVCPVEWARMENRTVLQWDKDDCAAVGLVKFDLLGLGMLEAIHRAVDTVGAYHHDEIDLATDPPGGGGLRHVVPRRLGGGLPGREPGADGDVAPVAAALLLRPRRRGRPHPPRADPGRVGPSLPAPAQRGGGGDVPASRVSSAALAKTLGVPLFQEQLMQMAIDAAGFSAAEADQLRQAMGSKRSASRMERLRARLYEGMAERGITGEIADTIWEQLAAFANFGFPESHSVSFAYLVYVSAWLKLHYPAAFLASLLNSQPMGFWAPHTLVADARRHGVVVLGPDVNKSEAGASLEPGTVPSRGAGPVVRLGLASVKGIGADLAEEIAAGRPYVDLEDLVRRSGIGRPGARSPRHVGSLAGLGGAAAGRRHGAAPAAAGSRSRRREALWAAGAAAEARPDRLPGTVVGTDATAAPRDGRDRGDVRRSADTRAVAGSSPMAFARAKLASRGVVPNAELVRVRRRGQGPRRRRGDPSAAAGYGGRDDVSQSGGRDGARERHLLAGMLDPLPQGGSLGGGAARAGTARAGRGSRPGGTAVLERGGGVPGGGRLRDGGRPLEGLPLTRRPAPLDARTLSRWADLDSDPMAGRAHRSGSPRGSCC